MPTIFTQYASEMWNRFGYRAVWLPNTPVSLGMVGTLDGERFQPETTLAECGIEFESGPVGNPIPFNYKSAGAVDIRFGVSGAAPDGSVADGDVEIAFGRRHAVLFLAVGCTTSRIKNLHALGDRILELHRDGEWRDDMVVVTERVATERATILISNQSDASVRLRAKAQVQAAEIDLAHGEAKFHVGSTRGLGFDSIGARDLTPLVRTSGIRKHWFRDPDFAVRADIDPDSDSPRAGLKLELKFDEVGFGTPWEES